MARQEGEQKPGIKESLKKWGMIGMIVGGIGLFVAETAGLVVLVGGGATYMLGKSLERKDK